MRIAVTRSGGLAGITRRAELDTSGRPDAAALTALARDAVAAGASPAPSGTALPDAFAYEITVGDRTLHCADPHLTDAQRALVRLLLREGGGGR